jgi:putative ABC transport system ATP-binding protein
VTEGEARDRTGAPEVIRAREVEKEYAMGTARVHALRGVDLEVLEREFVALVGPSGCGKSTLLNLLAGIDDPTVGEIEVLGNPLARLSESERARLRLHEIGFVFQRFHLLAVLSAAENVELPMAEAGSSRPERRRRTRELLDFVGLADRMHHRPSRLSGGEQQRVSIARALANRPRLLLADEPTGELDAGTGEVIISLFERVNREYGTTLVVVTHDPMVASRADRIVEMRDGRIAGRREDAGPRTKRSSSAPA